MLLLTNDGDFANKVAHPTAEVTKTYLVKLDGQPEAKHLAKLRTGVSIVGGRVSAKHIEKIKKTGENKSAKYEWYKIVITEGKNRQIRQMFEKIGFDVLRLQRVAIGRLRIGALKVGELAFINEAAVERVFLADEPDEVKAKRTYKGRAQTYKKNARGTNAAEAIGMKPAKKKSSFKSNGPKSGAAKSRGPRKGPAKKFASKR